MPLAKTGLVRITGSPEAELREMLRAVGVIPQKMNKALISFVEVARDTPLMKKLIAAAMYVSLEGIDPATAAPALGALNWREVLTTLRLLHVTHAKTQFSQVEVPPCDRGMTWSIDSSSVPGCTLQYWHV